MISGRILKPSFQLASDVKSSENENSEQLLISFALSVGSSATPGKLCLYFVKFEYMLKIGPKTAISLGFFAFFQFPLELRPLMWAQGLKPPRLLQTPLEEGTALFPPLIFCQGVLLIHRWA